MEMGVNKRCATVMVMAMVIDIDTTRGYIINMV